MTSLRQAAVAAVAVIFGATLFWATPSAHAAKPGSCGRPSGCTKYELIHAGSTYKWWPEGKRYEFLSSQGEKAPSVWKLTGQNVDWVAGKPGHGTLMMRVRENAGDAYGDWRYAKKNGRWEVRFRSLSKRWPDSSTVVMYDQAGAPIVVPATDANIRLELVPQGTGPVRCPANSILMAGWVPSQSHATLGVATASGSYVGEVTPWSHLSDLSWHKKWAGGNSKKSSWHVWAVELKPTTITWFLDGKVIRKAPRPAAIKNTKFSFRQSFHGSTDPNIQTAYAATQMDWARYWTLKRTTKDKKKLKALKNAPLLAPTTAATVGPC